jgi:hypothetical protein
MRFLLRFLLVIAGLIFAASLIVMMLVLLVVWSLRALWLKLTGRPVLPFEMRMNPRAGFDQVFRQGHRSASEPAKPSRRVPDDVTDVEPKR